MQSPKKLLIELEKMVLKTSADVPPDITDAYLGGRTSSLKFHGLKVPRQKKILTQFKNRLEGTPSQVLQLWDYVWQHSDIFEVMAMPLFYYGDLIRKGEDIAYAWPKMKSWVKRCDNWPHSDNLSFIYSKLFEDHPNLIKPTLEKWNKSRNPWAQRQSIVSLFYYEHFRKRSPSFAFSAKQVKPLLPHSDYYVQKGVGWTLREMSNAYPEKTLKFLESHATAISSIAFSAAVEKLGTKPREKLKAIRKTHREKKRQR